MCERTRCAHASHCSTWYSLPALYALSLGVGSQVHVRTITNTCNLCSTIKVRTQLYYTLVVWSHFLSASCIRTLSPVVCVTYSTCDLNELHNVLHGCVLYAYSAQCTDNCVATEVGTRIWISDELEYGYANYMCFFCKYGSSIYI